MAFILFTWVMRLPGALTFSTLDFTLDKPTGTILNVLPLWRKEMINQAIWPLRIELLDVLFVVHLFYMPIYIYFVKIIITNN